MSKKKQGTGPIPPGNQSPFGPGKKGAAEGAPDLPEGAPLSDRDPKSRLGNYETAGEHSIQQPGGKNGIKRTSGK